MIPNIEKARGLLKEYDKGDFHLLHGEVVSGIIRCFGRQYDPENEEYWGGYCTTLILNCRYSLSIHATVPHSFPYKQNSLLNGHSPCRQPA